MSSSQGIWLDEIAQSFEKLFILNFQTLKKTEKHDYHLKGENIEWISLGTNQGYGISLVSAVEFMVYVRSGPRK